MPVRFFWIQIGQVCALSRRRMVFVCGCESLTNYTLNFVFPFGMALIVFFLLK